MEGGALPSGIVSFVFTDIVGSTRLLRDVGVERYERVLLHHRAIGAIVRTMRRTGLTATAAADAVLSSPWALRIPGLGTVVNEC